MAIKTFRPITPARRHMTVSTFEGLAKVKKMQPMEMDVLAAMTGL